MTLLLNAVFHHALFIIPQQEIPGTMPSAYGEYFYINFKGIRMKNATFKL